VFHFLLVVVGVVDEHFEAQGVVLVLTYCEAVVQNEEAVGAETVAVEQLVTLAVASPMPRVH